MITIADPGLDLEGHNTKFLKDSNLNTLETVNEVGRTPF